MNDKNNAAQPIEAAALAEVQPEQTLDDQISQQYRTV
jgi:hypothetical protein